MVLNFNQLEIGFLDTKIHHDHGRFVKCVREYLANHLAFMVSKGMRLNIFFGDIDAISMEFYWEHTDFAGYLWEYGWTDIMMILGYHGISFGWITVTWCSFFVNGNWIQLDSNGKSPNPRRTNLRWEHFAVHNGCVECVAFPVLRLGESLYRNGSSAIWLQNGRNWKPWPMEIEDLWLIISGWWFGCHFLFSHIMEIIIPIDFHIFQRGWNHQPDLCTMNLPIRNCDVR